MVKRVRIVAGPNGSGKTTIINHLKNKISFGVYVNADEIEKTLIETRTLNFSLFSIYPTTYQLQHLFVKVNYRQ